jgi:predicted secreted protein
MIEGYAIPRREALKALGVLGVGLAAGGLGQGTAEAQAQAPALGQNESVQDAMKRLFGGKPIKDGAAVIKFDIPLIAENGSVVPVAVSVDSPMTPASYVKHIYVVADKNRIPVVTRVTSRRKPARPRSARTFASARPASAGDRRAERRDVAAGGA